MEKSRSGSSCHMRKNAYLRCLKIIFLVFFWYNFLFEHIEHIQTAAHGHSQLCLKCRLPNRISFEVFDWCFGKVETRACEMLRSFSARLFPLHVTVCGKPCDRLRQKPCQTRWVILSVRSAEWPLRSGFVEQCCSCVQWRSYICAKFW